VAVKPAPSAPLVHVTVVVPTPNVKPDAGEQVMPTLPDTTSVALAAYVAVAPAGLVAPTVNDAGSVSAGAVVSCTVTSKLAWPVLPAASVAEQVTVVEPSANVEFDALLQLTVSGDVTRSVADAASYVTTAPAALVASAITALDTVTAGFVVSSTVTTKLAEPVLPAASVAVHATVVEPSANSEPDALSHVAATLPSTASKADAAPYETGAPAALVASAVLSPDAVTTGAVVSRTVIVKLAEPVLPAPSVAEQVTVVVPTGNVVFDAWLQLTVNAAVTASVADAASYGTTAPSAFAADTMMSDGTVIAGLVVSCTVTVKLPVLVLPAASVAEQLTVVAPSANVVFDAGLQETAGVLTASVADAVP
jgi:hypothetical protein